jgi:hypothetical protein
MARIHILDQKGPGLYRAVVHATAPTGSNAAGVLWADAIKNSGNAVTIMPAGAGAGQITNNEANQIAAGAVIEAVFDWQDDPSWSNADRQANLDQVATVSIAELQRVLGERLKYFGATRG